VKATRERGGESFKGNKNKVHREVKDIR